MEMDKIYVSSASLTGIVLAMLICSKDRRWVAIAQIKPYR